MDQRYKFGYQDDTVYARVVGLVRTHAVPGGVVLDLGCGYGAIAEPCRDAGLDYVGLDLDDGALADLRDRGFGAASIDLRDAATATRALRSALGDRPLAAITLLDTLEHLTNGVEILTALRALAAERGPAPLVVSVPNVTHLDLAAKLLLGRWDVTPTGLLDETHVSLYSPDRLTQHMGEAGWVQVAADDFELSASDQHFPADAAPLAFTSPLHAVLRDLRAQAAPGAEVNQFVRAYLPGHRVEPAATGTRPGPFLSVVVRTRGTRLEALQDLLLCLAGQTNQDFELGLVCHNTDDRQEAAVEAAVADLPESLTGRVRLHKARGGGLVRPLLAGLDAATWRYIAVLDDDDLALGHWVQTLADLASAQPGLVLRTVVAEQDYVAGGWPDGSGSAPASVRGCPYPSHFDLAEHLVSNRSPLSGLAFPRSAFTDLGIRFDETLPAYADWDVLLRCALACGVASSPSVTVVRRRWANSSGADSALDRAAADLVLGRLDRSAQVVPAGTLSRLRDLTGALAAATAATAEAERAHAEAVGELAAVRASTSWRVSAPVRLAGRVSQRRSRPT